MACVGRVSIAELAHTLGARFLSKKGGRKKEEKKCKRCVGIKQKELCAAKIKGTNEDVVKEFPIFRAGYANESMHMGAPEKKKKKNEWKLESKLQWLASCTRNHKKR